MYDVAVAGAGPAGAVSATLMARAGLRVVLIDGGPTPSRIEGLSTRVTQVLKSLELPLGGLLGLASRHVNWPGVSNNINREFLVNRRHFDDALRAAAVAGGVDCPAARVIGSSPNAWHLSTGDALKADVLVDARGRRSAGVGERRRGPKSIAIAGLLEGSFEGGSGADQASGATPEMAQTSIHATPMGWIWRANWCHGSPGPTTSRWAQLVVDRNQLGGGAKSIAAAWHRCFELPQAGGYEALPSRLSIRGADVRLSAPTLGADRVAVGDAAVAMDPLAGHGVFWALSSALMSGPVVRAMLANKRDLANAFYSERVGSTFLRQARVGRDFYRLADGSGAARGVGNGEFSFWSSRAAWPDDLPAHSEFAAPSLVRRVIVREGELCEAEVLLTPQEPDGVAFVRGVEIAPLVNRLAQIEGVAPRLAIERILAQQSMQSEAGFVHDWMVSRGVLASETDFAVA